MNTIQEILDFVKDNDVQFINLAFSDLLGTQKNISIMPDELPAAFENGISFDAHAITGFRDVVNSDLLLFPDPATLSILPWQPSPGRAIRFYCDIKKPDGTLYEHDSRYLLKQVMKRFEDIGYVCKIGAESEFYIFKTDENGEPTSETIDKGGYLDIDPIDKGAHIRREICLTLDEMNIQPESSHHEQGPGQNEIDFRFSDALSSADNLLTFKSVVKTIAARHGYFASFMPKPIPDAPGSGLHVNISLNQNGYNIFKVQPDISTEVTNHFMAGIINHIQEITLFLNPIVNSYDRLGVFEAPKYITWSHQNRSQLIRIPASKGEKSRMELRSPDSILNPYLGFALILSAGLKGIEHRLTLPDPVDLDLYKIDAWIAKDLKQLPQNLNEAIQCAKDSPFVKETMGESMLNKFIELKALELKAYESTEDKQAFYKSRYFTSL